MCFMRGKFVGLSVCQFIGSKVWNWEPGAEWSETDSASCPKGGMGMTSTLNWERLYEVGTAPLASMGTAPLLSIATSPTALGM